MTEVLLGTMTFGDTVDRDGARQMLDRALSMGVNHIDTANVYTGGEGERILGELLVGRRDQVTLATKVGMPHEDAGSDPPLSPDAVIRCVEASLRRLATDRVDLLYLHQPDRSTPIEATLSAVAELQRQGKVVDFGLSNYAAWMTVDVERAASQAGMAGPVIGQQLLNLVARRLEEEYVEMARTHAIRTAAYNPLGGGLLTGRHSYDSSPAAGRFGDSRLAVMYQTRYWSRSTFDAIDAYQRIAADAGMPLIELALRWLAGHDGIDAVLVGASNVAHIVSNVELLGRGALPLDVVAAINEVGADLRGPMPTYHR